MKEQDFMLINISDREVGVLRTVGEREFVGTVKLLQGADSADNERLTEQLLQICRQYYYRVMDYYKKGNRGEEDGKIEL